MTSVYHSKSGKNLSGQAVLKSNTHHMWRGAVWTHHVQIGEVGLLKVQNTGDKVFCHSHDLLSHQQGVNTGTAVVKLSTV